MKKKRKLERKLLSFLLTLAMVMGLMPWISLPADAATSNAAKEVAVNETSLNVKSANEPSLPENVTRAKDGTLTYSEDGLGTGNFAEEAIEGGTVYRLYNKNSGEHFYTLSVGERDSVVKAGWTDEGVAYDASVKASDSDAVPVYRVFNPNAPADNSSHHYTCNAAEAQNLVSLGWRFEGVGFYVFPADRKNGMTVYREYNKNDGGHNYTTDKAEHDFLMEAGWADENTAWKVKDVQEVGTQKELEAVLATTSLTDLKIATNKKVELSIPEEDYALVDLIVDAPKASITNAGEFRSIDLRSIAANTWTEKGNNNNIVVNNTNPVRIIVDTLKGLASLNFNGSITGVNTLEVNSGTLKELVVTNTDPIDVSVSGEAKLASVAVDAATNVIVSGKDNAGIGTARVNTPGARFVLLLSDDSTAGNVTVSKEAAGTADAKTSVTVSAEDKAAVETVNVDAAGTEAVIEASGESTIGEVTVAESASGTGTTVDIKADGTAAVGSVTTSAKDATVNVTADGQSKVENVKVEGAGQASIDGTSSNVTKVDITGADKDAKVDVKTDSVEIETTPDIDTSGIVDNNSGSSIPTNSTDSSDNEQSGSIPPKDSGSGSEGGSGGGSGGSSGGSSGGGSYTPPTTSVKVTEVSLGNTNPKVGDTITATASGTNLSNTTITWKWEYLSSESGATWKALEGLLASTITSSGTKSEIGLPTKYGSNIVGWKLRATATASNGSTKTSAETSAIVASYTITAAEGIEHGSLAFSATRAAAGETITVTATPETGYGLAMVAVNDSATGVTITNNTATFKMPTDNVTVAATFAKNASETNAITFYKDKAKTHEYNITNYAEFQGADALTFDLVTIANLSASAKSGNVQLTFEKTEDGESYGAQSIAAPTVAGTYRVSATISGASSAYKPFETVRFFVKLEAAKNAVAVKINNVEKSPSDLTTSLTTPIDITLLDFAKADYISASATSEANVSFKYYAANGSEWASTETAETDIVAGTYKVVATAANKAGWADASAEFAIKLAAAENTLTIYSDKKKVPTKYTMAASHKEYADADNSTWTLATIGDLNATATSGTVGIAFYKTTVANMEVSIAATATAVGELTAGTYKVTISVTNVDKAYAAIDDVEFYITLAKAANAITLYSDGTTQSTEYTGGTTAESPDSSTFTLANISNLSAKATHGTPTITFALKAQGGDTYGDASSTVPAAGGTYKVVASVATTDTVEGAEKTVYITLAKAANAITLYSDGTTQSTEYTGGTTAESPDSSTFTLADISNLSAKATHGTPTITFALKAQGGDTYGDASSTVPAADGTYKVVASVAATDTVDAAEKTVYITLAKAANAITLYSDGTTQSTEYTGGTTAESPDSSTFTLANISNLSAKATHGTPTITFALKDGESGEYGEALSTVPTAGGTYKVVASVAATDTVEGATKTVYITLDKLDAVLSVKKDGVNFTDTEDTATVSETPVSYVGSVPAEAFGGVEYDGIVTYTAKYKENEVGTFAADTSKVEVSTAGAVTFKAAGLVELTISAPATAKFNAATKVIIITVKEKSATPTGLTAALKAATLDTITITSESALSAGTYKVTCGDETKSAEVIGESTKAFDVTFTTGITGGETTVSITYTADGKLESNALALTVNPAASYLCATDNYQSDHITAVTATVDLASLSKENFTTIKFTNPSNLYVFDTTGALYTSKSISGFGVDNGYVVELETDAYGKLIARIKKHESQNPPSGPTTIQLPFGGAVITVSQTPARIFGNIKVREGDGPVNYLGSDIQIDEITGETVYTFSSEKEGFTVAANSGTTLPVGFTLHAVSPTETTLTINAMVKHGDAATLMFTGTGAYWGATYLTVTVK